MDSPERLMDRNAIQNNRGFDLCIQPARLDPMPPHTSQPNKMMEMVISLPLTWAINSRIVTSWVTTEAIPVAMTRMKIVSLVLFFKILNLVGLNLKL